mmetsp:Transcript_10739/g.28169  ORF Transcript_10739/g.28169 Transcript_10739/m.28169 type:complete len:539 (-) Transcript_10739:46-1662(-)
MATPMVTEVQSAEELQKDKYDRQKRLWGEGGQVRLSKASVCLLGASATGTETLKNLVLGGIKGFTVVDGEKTSERDLGQNFFVTKSRLGEPRAEVTADLLAELNPDVARDAICERPEELIERNPSILRPFSLIVAVGLRHHVLLPLSRTCKEYDIPLIALDVNGMIGMVRLYIGEHVVVESKPDNTIRDLRITAPFAELKSYLDGLVPSERLPTLSHSHVPYIAVLYHVLKKWKEEKGQGPSTYAEKKAFKEEVAQLDPTATQVNIQEAMAAVNTLFNSTRVPDRVREILKKAKDLNAHADLSSFWIIMKAISDFVDTEGVLPLPGSLPDLECDTATYLELQQLYKEKAEKDIADIRERVEDILSTIGRGANAISADEVRTVCKNAYVLDVMQYGELSEEDQPSESLAMQFMTAKAMDTESDALWYVLFRAAERFAVKYSHMPGESNGKDASVDVDAQMLRSEVAEICSKLQIDSALIDDKYAAEYCRYGNSELHNIASFIGGVAAQEGIKIITRQLITLNSVFIFNGTKGTGLQFSL